MSLPGDENAAKNSPQPEDISREQQQHQAQQQWENNKTALQRYFASEPPDPVWAQSVEVQLVESIGNIESSLDVRNISCTAAVCEITSQVLPGANGDVDTQFRMDHLFFGEMNWQGPMIGEYNSETGEMIAWLAKEGVEIESYFDEGGEQ